MPKYSLKRYVNKLIVAAALMTASFFVCSCAKQQEETFVLETLEASFESTEISLLTETESEEKESNVQADAETAESAAAVCVVHICGAVHSPGVYELTAGSRIVDAVNAGGGFLPEADQAAHNLAETVTDGSQIYIMTKEEAAVLKEAAGSISGGSFEQNTVQENETLISDGRVNINTAGPAELMTLPGIGENKAAAIIDFREKNGSFGAIEDIMKVSGIKQAAFDKLKDKIKV